MARVNSNPRSRELNYKYERISHVPIYYYEASYPYEEFRPITSVAVPKIVPGAYIVSNYGRVLNTVTKEFVKDEWNANGIRVVMLRIVDTLRIQYTFPIHQIVMKTFKYNEYLEIKSKAPKGDPVVLFLDGNPKNCWVNIPGVQDNLVWQAYEIENKEDVQDRARKKYTEKDTNCTQEMIHTICMYLEMGWPPLKTSKVLCINYDFINDIYNHKIWTTVSQNYDF